MPDTDFPEVSQFDGGPKELRDAYERLRKSYRKVTEENTSLLSGVRASKIAQAGFPEGSKQHTVLLKHYQGDVADLEAIASFAAEEFGYEPAGSTPPPTDEADEATGAQRRLDALTGDTRTRSLAPPPGQLPALQAAVLKAEADGNWEEAIRLKNEIHRLLE